MICGSEVGAVGRRALGAGLRATGFALLDTSEDQFKALGHLLGTPIPGRPSGPLIDHLHPMVAADARPRSLSALHGVDAFPLHTDGAHHRVPPRYVLMRLADEAHCETPTLLARIDPRSLLRRDVTLLARETWLVRGGFGRTFFAPVLDNSRMIMRFDPGCMTQPLGTQLTGARILSRMFAATQVVRIDWEPGRTLVIDNWTVFHGRPQVVTDVARRVLLRQLVA